MSPHSAYGTSNWKKSSAMYVFGNTAFASARIVDVSSYRGLTWVRINARTFASRAISAACPPVEWP